MKEHEDRKLCVNVFHAQVRGVQVRVLFVKGIPEGVSEERLVDLFSQYGEVSKVIIPAPKPGQPRRDFGFVHFVARASALKAIAAEKHEVEGENFHPTNPPPQ